MKQCAGLHRRIRRMYRRDIFSSRQTHHTPPHTRQPPNISRTKPERRITPATAPGLRTSPAAQPLSTSHRQCFRQDRQKIGKPINATRQHHPPATTSQFNQPYRQASPLRQDSGNNSGNEAPMQHTRQLEPHPVQSRITSPLNPPDNISGNVPAKNRQHSGNISGNNSGNTFAARPIPSKRGDWGLGRQQLSLAVARLGGAYMAICGTIQAVSVNPDCSTKGTA